MVDFHPARCLYQLLELHAAGKHPCGACLKEGLKLSDEHPGIRRLLLRLGFLRGL